VNLPTEKVIDASDARRALESAEFLPHFQPWWRFAPVRLLALKSLRAAGPHFLEEDFWPGMISH
jgi:hypothetical protein